MPEQDHPGVDHEEIAANSQPIRAVPTSRTGFIGKAERGVFNGPTLITSFAEYKAQFGDFSPRCPMSYAVHQYFTNGGAEAVVVRVARHKGCALAFAPESSVKGEIGFLEIGSPTLEGTQSGLWAFDKGDKISLLNIPPFGEEVDVDVQTWQAAIRYCDDRRIFLIIDPPSTWDSVPSVLQDSSLDALRHPNAAVYFPRLRVQDPLTAGQTILLAPGGAIAGVYARTDRQSGVWKAPAGTEAVLADAQPETALNSNEMDSLNQITVNPIRVVARKTVVWDSRTLVGVDAQNSEWKYVPVRRTALMLEESLDQGLKWVVFEPNDETLWAQVRMRVEEFLMTLFRQGAFQGTSPRDAFFVRCDRTTMTQGDLDLGMLNVLVGFAPLKPAEFVILRLQFKTGSQGDV